MRRSPLRSPPRMRGKAIAVHHLGTLIGITPAYAGKRFLSFLPAVHQWDHPRVCGEKAAPLFGELNHTGSPPRMRGKGRIVAVTVAGFGITPAYAGKRPVKHTIEHLHGDHPRVCGEKLYRGIRYPWSVGSPPRMRGKVSGSHPYSSRTGITPAYAGKSGSLRFSSGQCRDHPRVCGEKRTAFCVGFCV